LAVRRGPVQYMIVNDKTSSLLILIELILALPCLTYSVNLT